jgi:hypothetical protein
MSAFGLAEIDADSQIPSVCYGWAPSTDGLLWVAMESFAYRPISDLECPGFVARKPSLTWAPGGAKTPSRRHNCLHTLVGSATIDGDALLGMRPQSNSSAGAVLARFFGIPTFEERFSVSGRPADSLHRLP